MFCLPVNFTQKHLQEKAHWILKKDNLKIGKILVLSTQVQP